MHMTRTNASATEAAQPAARRGRAAKRRDRSCSNGGAPVGQACVGQVHRPPVRGDIDQAAIALIRRHGREILATARRYASNLDDAEDAYQRGLEILLTKAPTTREVELVRWLKTVVKHEAFALRRQRERRAPITDDGEVGERPTPPGIIHDQAERHERLHQGGEALALLKPQEARALRLRAEGYSYREICRITAWSYTKVNRCLTEGRRALHRRATAIEAGEECERLAPLLAQAVGHLAEVDDRGELHRHLGGCLSCRASLRSLRAVERGPQNHRRPSASARLRDQRTKRRCSERSGHSRAVREQKTAGVDVARGVRLVEQRPRRRYEPAGSQRSREEGETLTLVIGRAGRRLDP
jgi:RNA polymerase sigma factor (sigma-70 family)